MIGFQRLHLRGFKSFADSTEVEIAPGLTGIIGPNGCGKSNILEALRWVMGESSAKSMRSGEMEDVIFAGTRARPAREGARVTLTLDNAAGTAPAPWAAAPSIEVTRSITRGQGSAFRINGKAVRSRDAQLLFSDSASGPRSPALVSQGRIAAMMTVKPAERRKILEDAAGIAGLYARRGEATQRLNAAQANLARVGDQLADMRTRAAALARQARQAENYRALSEEIRALEAAIALAGWAELAERLAAAKDAHAECEAALAERMAAAASLARTQEDAAAQTTALRRAEAEARTAVDRARAALESLEAEAARHAQAQADATQRLEQTRADAQHERGVLAETEARLAALDGEAGAIAPEDPEALAALAQELEALEAAAQTATQAYEAALATDAQARAERTVLERRVAESAERLGRLKTQHADAQAARASLPENGPDIDMLEREYVALDDILIVSRQQAQELDATIAARRSRLREAEAAAGETQRAATGLACEIAALAPLVEAPEARPGDHAPVLHAMRVEAGMETALAIALGAGLDAGLDAGAPRFWDILGHAPGGLPPLPHGARALTDVVTDAPPALARALAACGVVEAQGADALAAQLQPGQCLVTTEGALWRWDGYRQKPGAEEGGHARALEQKNRLVELRAREPDLQNAAQQSEAEAAAARAALEEAEAATAQLTRAQRETEGDLAQKRAELEAARQDAARHTARRARLDEALEGLAREIAALTEALAADRRALDDTGGADSAQALEAAQEAVAQARAAETGARRDHDAQVQAASAAKARARAIADERVSLQNQAIRARSRVQELTAREAEQAQALAEMADAAPGAPEARTAASAALDGAQGAYDRAGAALRDQENRAAQTAQALTQEQGRIATLRERRAVAGATRTSLEEQIEGAARALESKFGCTPGALAARAGDQPEGGIDALTARCGALTRRREALGAVNLRAQAESAALTAELEALEAEEADLAQATDELHAAIRKLNKEARARLLDAFAQVDAHFQDLFVRLFGGGRAHLSLAQGDDPLEAGLEVFAQPPGKSLASLSLLSGGEQTMAAIALILALFLTAPAPLCVLDEIDAALDDANVERVCDLVEEIARRGETRFLIITHHRLTMARMDRLYGVTMAERGVSTLVSVDLQESFAFMDAA